jgi:shikimate kinase
MMGAGKSSVGRRLAARLNVAFRDADAEIESAAGCTISEIFARYGEAAFRDGERKVIGRLLTQEPHVMATGGGAFVDSSTREKLKLQSVTVWLKAPIELLLARNGAIPGHCCATAIRARSSNGCLLNAHPSTPKRNSPSIARMGPIPRW